jgi:hypothetical protein
MYRLKSLEVAVAVLRQVTGSVNLRGDSVTFSIFTSDSIGCFGEFGEAVQGLDTT